MEFLSIGKVARQAGITVETVRFYEKKGLVTLPDRTEAGYRQYPVDAVQRLRFIRNAKELGFTLNDIGELLSLRRQPGSSCADVKLRTLQKIEDVDRKIGDLNKIRDALGRMVLKCSGRGDLRECPILDELELDDEP